MGYIGFYLIMIGLAAAGGAIERGDSLIGAMALTAGGAALMWLYREEEDSEEEDDSADSGGSSPVDKPSGESRGRCGENTQCRDRRGIPDFDNGILSWDSHSDRKSNKTGYLRRKGGMDREDRSGVGI